MRCLGLDLGTKTLGIAISDKTNQIASFLKVVRWDGEHYDLLFKELSPLIEENGITTLVLGLPKNMNNSLGFAAERSLNFEKALNQKLSELPPINQNNLISNTMTLDEGENTINTFSENKIKS